MQTFDPLPSTTSVQEFDDYVAGYRYYSSEIAHIALQNVAHRLARVDMKEADVNLYTPRILFIFRELKKDLYIIAIMDDTLQSLKDSLVDDRSPMTAELINVFDRIMLAARIKLKEIHGVSLGMGALEEVTSSGLLSCDKGGEDYILDIPPMTALDEA